MTFGYTKEMNELYDIFDKWMIWTVKKDSPQEVKEAEKKYLELRAFEEERQRPLIEKGKQRWVEETKEMWALYKVFESWLERRFVDDAPEEARQAKKKYDELYEYEYERQMRLEGYI